MALGQTNIDFLLNKKKNTIKFYFAIFASLLF
jgi:hypothetical protein